MRMVHLIRGRVHTSAACSTNRYPHPKDELRGSNDREPNRDRNVFQHHGVYPATTSSGVNSGPLVKKGKSTPKGYRHLREEGTKGKREEGVPRAFFAPGYMRILVW